MREVGRVEGVSFAQHNAVAKEEADELIEQYVEPLAVDNLLAEGMSPHSFARIWYALFFGQIAVEGGERLATTTDEWLEALHVIASSMVRPD